MSTEQGISPDIILPLLKERQVRVTFDNGGSDSILVGVPRNLVGEHDENFWFPGDTDKPRLWLTAIFEHFIPLDKIKQIVPA